MTKQDRVTLTRTKKAARPSIMLEFLVRYAILSLSCRYVVKVVKVIWRGTRYERGVKKRREIRRLFFHSPFISFSPHLQRPCILHSPPTSSSWLYCLEWDTQRRVSSDVKRAEEGDETWGRGCCYRWNQSDMRGISNSHDVWVVPVPLFSCLIVLGVVYCHSAKGWVVDRGSALGLGGVFCILWCLCLRLERHIAVRYT